jgi:hypothetical protein
MLELMYICYKIVSSGSCHLLTPNLIPVLSNKVSIVGISTLFGSTSQSHLSISLLSSQTTSYSMNDLTSLDSSFVIGSILIIVFSITCSFIIMLLAVLIFSFYIHSF